MTARDLNPASDQPTERPGQDVRRARLTRHWWPYLSIAPFYVLFLVFGLFPYGYAFVLSFQRWDGIGPAEWAGLANYAQLLQDPVWWKSLYNTLWLLLAAVLSLALALVLAFTLNNGMIRFKHFFQTVFFMPVIASSVALALVFSALLGTRYGLLNYLLGFMGIEPIDWLGDAFWIKPSIAMLVIWQLVGWNTVIYLAGLQRIPVELYEAARVDGAALRHIFLHITLPLMRPVITFTAILTIIGGLQLFDAPLMLAGGAPYSGQPPGGTDQAGLTVMVNLYNSAFSYLEFGYAAAMSVVVFIIIVMFSFAYNRTFGRIEESS